MAHILSNIGQLRRPRFLCPVARPNSIAQGTAQAIGLQSLMRDFGWDIKITILSDATAAIALPAAKGSAKCATWMPLTSGSNISFVANRLSLTMY